MTPHFHFQVRIRERYKLLLLLGLGAAGGAVFIRQAGLDMEEQIISGGSAFLAALAQSGGEGEELFIRLLWGRAWLPAVFVALSFTALGLASLYLFWVYLGFAMTTTFWAAMALFPP